MKLFLKLFAVQILLTTPLAYAQDKSQYRVNPWKGWKKGSWVHYKWTKGPGDKPDGLESKVVLVSPGGKSYYKSKTLVKTSPKDDWFPGKVSKTSLKKGKAKPGYVLNVEKGKKTITTPAGTFECDWEKRTTKDGFSESWYCDKVPNRIVKTVMVHKGKRSGTILFDYSKNGGKARKLRPKTGD
jgi:hypothetical protein